MAQENSIELAFDTFDRTLKRFSRIDDVRAADAVEEAFVQGVAPIWEQLVALGQSASAGAWDDVPTDLAERIDDLVYRRAQDPA